MEANGVALHLVDMRAATFTERERANNERSTSISVGVDASMPLYSLGYRHASKLQSLRVSD